MSGYRKFRSPEAIPPASACADSSTPPAKVAKVAKTPDYFSNFSNFSRGERENGDFSPVSASLLSCPDPGASSPQVERERQRQAEPGEESHVAPAVEAQSLSPALCLHRQWYTRPSGVKVCGDCAATLAPGAKEWQRQQIAYCQDGQHTWYPRCEGDGGMLQCSKCPEVQAAQAGERQRDPAVHDPHCLGTGLVVVKGFGWSCPQCNGRYVVPEAPVSTTPGSQAALALPLGASAPHGEVPQQRKVRR